jgi:3alpha(or 20beta)-hydroxysteroid dehydrogenase
LLLEENAMRGLDGKTALVTGGAGGLGSSITQRLVEEGVSVLVTDIDADGAERVAARFGERAVAVEHDISDEASWARAIDAARQHFGGLQLLVNNAATTLFKSFADTALGEFEHLLRVNLVGPFLGMKAAIPVIAEAGEGAIVNVASVHAHRATAGLSSYVTSKHAVLGLSKSVAMEAAPFGIRVNAVCPGGMDTPRTREDFAGVDLEAIAARTIPLGRIGDTPHVAAVVCFLLSDDAGYVTGTDFLVDGGLINQLKVD